MVQRQSPRRRRALEEFGENLRRWRRINGMSATQLAERASITRDTLRSIEGGTGTARLDSVMAVLLALGISDSVVGSTDPYRNDAARARIDDLLSSGGTL